jgi:hypothetical protein
MGYFIHVPARKPRKEVILNLAVGLPLVGDGLLLFSRADESKKPRTVFTERGLFFNNFLSLLSYWSLEAAPQQEHVPLVQPLFVQIVGVQQIE